MSRAFLFILDSFGIGGAPDAAAFGDEGANTVGHIARHFAEQGLTLQLPVMNGLGLGRAAAMACGSNPLGDAPLSGRWGAAVEVSKGKDTITGHWEIAGVPVPFAWHYYPDHDPAFPPDLLEAIVARAQVPGLLSLRHASGTQVIQDFGVEHIRTGKPIMYTSADSVIQFAAHEQHFGLERLYALCRVARELTYDIKVGRIIARPFIGESPADFTRTGNRKDFAITPPSPTLLQLACDQGRQVIAVGKIGDIYAHVGTGEEVKVHGNAAMMEKVISLMPDVADGGLLMTNFVDFDTNHGHRRDIMGYGRLLEAFDRSLPRVLAALRPGDVLILTADHGNDPSWRGTDHTREQVPVLVAGPGMVPGSLGQRHSFADMGQSLARHLGLPALTSGTSFF